MINAWIDGATDKTNPSKILGSGAVMYVDQQEPIILKTKTLFEGGTNNLAEYVALYDVLDYLDNYTNLNNDITIHSDSRLLVNQMNGHWRIKEGIYKDEANDCLKLINRLSKSIDITLIWVPREQNEEADKLSKEALLITN